MAGCSSCGGERRDRSPSAARPSVALAGNPNTGKSSIFNLLTRSRQHVGNWPGKTVSRVVGTFDVGETRLEAVDLPGTYSLNVSSPEEMIARDYLVSGEPGAVVGVVDAANLERNLYLTVQILEMAVPVAIALNMMDVAASRGIVINADRLSARLGAPVVETVARKGKGMDELKSAIAGLLESAGAV